MQPSTESQIIAAEQQLRTAMLRSDVNILNDLLASELIFTNHFGQILFKKDDLSAHQTGLLNIDVLSPSEQHIQIIGDIAIVSVLVHIVGSYDGESAENDFRFTRIWSKASKSSSGSWQVIAAHSSIVA